MSSLISGTLYLYYCFNLIDLNYFSSEILIKICLMLFIIYFFSLTGVSPFAGENDRASALNIRNYNVAFEESMFADLCKEAKGFVIKLLVVDRL